ncbi:hypothetical protein OH492_09560 [Vibrio chagasii]|nr:hypothetical protein [Vibrio chagasii]
MLFMVRSTISTWGSFSWQWLLQESGRSLKVSHRGAVGIMQVMLNTARDWYVDIDNVYDLKVTFMLEASIYALSMTDTLISLKYSTSIRFYF